MNILVSMSSCNDPGIARLMSAMKNGLTLIQIVVPILLIVMASVNLFKLASNPEDKKGLTRVKNGFIAAVIVFFIPMIIDILMNVLGTNTTISSCWNNSNTGSNNPGYVDPGDTNNKKSKVYTDPGDYQ